MSNQTRLVLDNLTIGYRDKRVAGPLSAELRSGELTSLLGQNGAGKSTLLRTIANFIQPLEGRVLIDGRGVSQLGERELSKLVGVVLTERFNIPDMTVYEMVATGRSPFTGFWGSCSKADREIIEHSIELAGIAALRERLIDSLSDGERQKVMIAKVLAQRTPIIILDEPTAFLDFPSKVDLMNLLHKISREEHKTIFISSHDLELALQMSDRLWLIDKSKGLSCGIPEDLSLTGVLGGFFAERGVTFDSESGLFRVTNKFDYSIRLTGHGRKFSMVRKALNRNRIEASGKIDSPSVIDCGDSSSLNLIVRLSGEPEVVVTSVEAMLELVKAYFQTHRSSQ